MSSIEETPIEETPSKKYEIKKSLICEHWLKGRCAYDKKCNKVHVCKANLHKSCLRAGPCKFVHMEQEVLNQLLVNQQRQVTQYVRIPKHILAIAVICVIVFYFL